MIRNRRAYEGNLKFVKENCTTYAERKEFNEMMLESASTFANAINQKLVESFIDKAQVDFESIPDSKGRIDRYIGYSALTESLELLAQARANNKGKNNKVDNVSVISETIGNIVGLGDKFTLAFKIDNKVLTTMYCTLVMAVVQATSVEISYSIDDDGKLLSTNPSPEENHTVEMLRDFNKSVRDTTIPAEMNKILAESNKNLLGSMSVSASVVLVAGAFFALIPILRELIYLYYNSRMQVSNLIDQQVYFIETNKRNLDNGAMPSAKRKQVVAKQTALIKKLSMISDKIRVDHKLAIKGAEHEMKAENKKWTLKKLDDETINDKMMIF